MSKPDNPSSALPGARPATIAAAALLVGTAALHSLPGAMAGTRIDRREAAPAATVAQNAPATYQLRCWQYGRLLFDEGPLILTAEARQGARLVALDRHGATLILTDTGATTCLARPIAAPPAPAATP